MSAIAALEAARAAGVRLKVEGNDLVLEASAAPPSAVLDLLSRNKAGIATILRPGLSGWSTERLSWLNSPFSADIALTRLPELLNPIQR
jgi:hypothetical protein